MQWLRGWGVSAPGPSPHQVGQLQGACSPLIARPPQCNCTLVMHNANLLEDSHLLSSSFLPSGSPIPLLVFPKISSQQVNHLHLDLCLKVHFLGIFKLRHRVPDG